MKIISFEGTTSFHDEMRKICSPFESLFLEKQMAFRPDNDQEVNTEINCLFDRNNYDACLYNSVRDFAELCSFEFFHSTRLVSKAGIEREGLVVLSKAGYLQRMQEVFKNSPFTVLEREKVIDALSDCLDKEAFYRCERIAFFAPLSAYQSWNKFSMNIGGEVAEHTLKYSQERTLQDAYTYLCNLGNPYLVKVALEWSDLDMSGFGEERIVNALLRLFFAKEYLDIEYKPEVDCISRKNVLYEKVLDIISI